MGHLAPIGPTRKVRRPMTLRSPDPEHRLFGQFWRASSEGCLNLPRCQVCEIVLWPPAELCPGCLSSDIQWSEVKGDGVVWGVARYEHPFTSALADEVPYQCVLVDLDCGPHLIAFFVGDGSNERARPGQRVGAVRVKTGDYSLPCFAPLVSSSSSS